MTDRYRLRVYGEYASARHQPLAPETLEGLRPRLPYLRELIRHHFPGDKDAVILDLGCGHGALMHVATQLGYRNVRGVDGSAQQIAVAHRLGIECVIEGDVSDALHGLADESLDLVVSFDLIEHFTRDELLDVVDEVHRVLKPSGQWMIHTCNGESPFFGASMYGDLTHELAFTSASIGQLLFTSGFGSVECFEDVPVVHGAKSALRWVLWKLIRGMLRLYWAAETGDLGRKAVFSRNFLVVASKAGMARVGRSP